MNSKRLLVVGPLPNEELHCQYGGATVLMRNFVEFLSERDYRFRFVQTNKFVNRRSLELRPALNLLYLILKLLWELPMCEIVMFNFSDRSTVSLFPYLQKVAHLFGKKVVLRKFGGSLDIYLSRYSKAKTQRTAMALSHADLVFFETKASIAFLKEICDNKINVQWFPNVRKPPPTIERTKEAKRLAYIGHVSREKGVLDVLDAFLMLPSGYTLDIYGAVKDGWFKDFNWTVYGATYHGEIPAVSVAYKLASHSLLLLSSYREGYPGIIIEAMAAGTPCVASTVGGIPEIVQDGFNGKLVPAGNPKVLAEAIDSISPEDAQQMSRNAKKTFDNHFNSDKVNQRIIDDIHSLVENK